MVDNPKSCNERLSCSTERILSLIGSKWTLQILREFLDGTKRFGQLKKSLPGISPKTLSQRLQELEKEGILAKKVYPEVPPRVEYTPTPRGEGLKSILLALAEWGSECPDQLCGRTGCVRAQLPQKDRSTTRS